MRQKLSEQYKIEREELCLKILNLLDLTSEGTFLLCELDSNLEKQQKILELKPEIKKYFSCYNISAFKPNFQCKRPYLNIIRSILRDQNYTVENSDYWLKYDNGLLKRTIKYKIFRNN